MDKSQKQPRESPFLDARTSFYWVVFLADIHTGCIRPLTRSHMGPHGLGWPGFWAMLAIPVYAGLAEAPEMLTYWYWWMGLVIYRRITADKIQHTQYQGWPWMFDWCMNDEMNARAMEAGTMPLLGGLVACLLGEQAGAFVAAGVFSFGLRYVIDASAMARRREAARNARIDMEQMQTYYD